MKVVRIGGSGVVRKRLLEMGLTRGALVKIVKYAPLRDPMELALGDFRISVRVSEADTIEIEPVVSDSPAPDGAAEL